MTSALLPPQEFVNRLIAMLSGADGLVEQSIEEYNKKTAEYGNEERFEEAQRKLSQYLEHMMHKTKDIGTIIAGVEYFVTSGRVPKHEYLTYAKDAFQESHLRFSQVFVHYKEFSTRNGVLKPECQQILDALSACVAFSKEQYALAAPNQQVGRA